jgi:hypothetical protein
MLFIHLFTYCLFKGFFSNATCLVHIEFFGHRGPQRYREPQRNSQYRFLTIVFSNQSRRYTEEYRRYTENDWRCSFTKVGCSLIHPLTYSLIIFPKRCSLLSTFCSMPTRYWLLIHPLTYSLIFFPRRCSYCLLPIAYCLTFAQIQRIRILLIHVHLWRIKMLRLAIVFDIM